jgi:hypothetical protein
MKSKKSADSKGRTLVKTGKGSITVTAARAVLCPLVKEVDQLPEGKLGITVGGSVAAYLVSARKLETLEAKARAARPPTIRPRLAGSLEIVGDLEAGSREAAQELEQTAVQSWNRVE